MPKNREGVEEKTEKNKKKMEKFEHRIATLKKLNATSIKLLALFMLNFDYKTDVGDCQKEIEEKFEIEIKDFLDLLKSMRSRLEALGQEWNCKEIEGNEKEVADKEKYANILDFYELIKNAKPKLYKEVDADVKVILKKVVDKKTETKKAREDKKERVRRKKEAGEFLPAKEYELVKAKKKEERKLAKKKLQEQLAKDKKKQAELEQKFGVATVGKKKSTGQADSEDPAIKKVIKKAAPHPSWEAKKALRDQESTLVKGAGKVVEL